MIGACDKDANCEIISKYDDNGHLIDNLGRRINLLGYLIDEAGNIINKYGKKIFDKKDLEDSEMPKLIPEKPKFELNSIFGKFKMNPFG